MHLITQFDTVYTPKDDVVFEKTWHGLETPVENGIQTSGSNISEVFCPIVECGLKPDFEGEIAETSEDLRDFVAANPLSDWKLLLADCRNSKSGKVLPIHIPKKGYKIHQNRTLFDAIVMAAKDVLGEGGFKIVTVGTLGGYTQFFVSIAVKNTESFEVTSGSKDLWKQFFNLNSSHNGLVSSNCMLSTVRIVCFNTLNSSVDDATDSGTISKIRHTSNSDQIITAKTFAVNLTMWIKKSESFKLVLETLKNEKMTVDSFKAFATGVFTNAMSDQLSTTSFNRINEMLPLFQRGIGNSGQSRYDAINAFTEYFTHGTGTGSDKVKLNKRVASANFGRGNDWKLEALRIASDQSEFAVALERGEKLFLDKEKEMTTKN